MNHWTEETGKSWNTQLVTMAKKKNGKLTMRGFPPIAMLPTIYRLYSKTLQQLAGQDSAIKTRTAVRSRPWSAGLYEVVWMLRRVVEQAIEWQHSGLRDGLRCGSCIRSRLTPRNHQSNVSHGCPAGADCRLGSEKYRNSETLVKLDDIVTPGIRRARSVPRGDPCAADWFGAALDTPAVKFCDMCQLKNGTACVGNGYLGLRALRGQLLDHRDVARRAPNDGKSVERTC